MVVVGLVAAIALTACGGGSTTSVSVITTTVTNTARSSAATSGVIRRGVLQFQIDGSEMAPTLADGSIVDIVPAKSSELTRGAVVLFLVPNGGYLVKRVIGLPGDSIRIVPDYAPPAGARHAAVEVKPGGTGSWQVVTEGYLPDQSKDRWTRGVACCTREGVAGDAPTEATVPAGGLFALGDNRNASKDSRDTGFYRAEWVTGIVGDPQHDLGAPTLTAA